MRAGVVVELSRTRHPRHGRIRRRWGLGRRRRRDDGGSGGRRHLLTITAELQVQLDQPFIFDATSTLALVLSMMVSGLGQGWQLAQGRRGVMLACACSRLARSFTHPTCQISAVASAVGVGGGPI